MTTLIIFAFIASFIVHNLNCMDFTRSMEDRCKKSFVQNQVDISSNPFLQLLVDRCNETEEILLEIAKSQEILRENDSLIAQPNDGGYTPLYLIVQKEYIDLALYWFDLLDEEHKTIAATIKSESGNTLLHLTLKKLHSLKHKHKELSEAQCLKLIRLAEKITPFSDLTIIDDDKLPRGKKYYSAKDFYHEFLATDLSHTPLHQYFLIKEKVVAEKIPTRTSSPKPEELIQSFAELTVDSIDTTGSKNTGTPAIDKKSKRNIIKSQVDQIALLMTPKRTEQAINPVEQQPLPATEKTKPSSTSPAAPIQLKKEKSVKYKKPVKTSSAEVTAEVKHKQRKEQTTPLSNQKLQQPPTGFATLSIEDEEDALMTASSKQIISQLVMPTVSLEINALQSKVSSERCAGSDVTATEALDESYLQELDAIITQANLKGLKKYLKNHHKKLTSILNKHFASRKATITIQNPLYAAIITGFLEGAKELTNQFPSELVRKLILIKDQNDLSVLSFMLEHGDVDKIQQLFKEWSALDYIDIKQGYSSGKTLEQYARDAGLLGSTQATAITNPLLTKKKLTIKQMREQKLRAQQAGTTFSAQEQNRQVDEVVDLFNQMAQSNKGLPNNGIFITPAERNLIQTIKIADVAAFALLDEDFRSLPGFIATCLPGKPYETIRTNPRPYYGAVLHAMEAHNIESVRYFINKIDDINQPLESKTQTTLLIHLLRCESDNPNKAFVVAATKVLCKHSSFDPNARDIFGSTALHVMLQDYQLLGLLIPLLSTKPQFDIFDYKGITSIDLLINSAETQKESNLDFSIQALALLMKESVVADMVFLIFRVKGHRSNFLNNFFMQHHELLRTWAEAQGNDLMALLTSTAADHIIYLLLFNAPEVILNQLLQRYNCTENGKDPVIHNALSLAVTQLRRPKQTEAVQAIFKKYAEYLLNLTTLDIWTRHMNEEQRQSLLATLQQEPAITIPLTLKNVQGHTFILQALPYFDELPSAPFDLDTMPNLSVIF